jgi:beta-lactamase class A
MPPEIKIAFRTGGLAETRPAAGILERPAGPVAFCVLSCENEDKRSVPDHAGNRLCTEIARALFEDHQRPTNAAGNP